MPLTVVGFVHRLPTTLEIKFGNSTATKFKYTQYEIRTYGFAIGYNRKDSFINMSRYSSPVTLSVFGSIFQKKMIFKYIKTKYIADY